MKTFKRSMIIGISAFVLFFIFIILLSFLADLFGIEKFKWGFGILIEYYLIGDLSYIKGELFSFILNIFIWLSIIILFVHLLLKLKISSKLIYLGGCLSIFSIIFPSLSILGLDNIFIFYLGEIFTFPWTYSLWLQGMLFFYIIGILFVVLNIIFWFCIGMLLTWLTLRLIKKLRGKM